MNPTKVEDFCKTALKRLLVSNDTPSPKITPAQLNDALNELNLITDSWNADGQTIYSQQFYTFALVPGQQTYTIGPVLGTGGLANTASMNTGTQPRPSYLEYASFQQTDPFPVNDLPMKIVDAAEWASISVKQIAASVGFYVYLDGAYPWGNLNIWPLPTVAANVVLTTWLSLPSALGFNDTISMPPAYARGLSLDLTLACAPYYGKSGSATVQQLAGTLAKIKRDIGWVNIRGGGLRYSESAQGSDGGGGVYDAITDTQF
jgi:hypothetical protein